MTDETKKLFSAPWVVKHYVHACWEVDFEVSTTDRMSVAVSPTEEHANRIARLPELYDALKESAYEHCRVCLYCHAEDARHMPKPQDMATVGCTVSDYPYCPNRIWWEVLQKVSAGQ